MTLYFFDEEAQVLVAYDKDARTVRVLNLVGEVEFEEGVSGDRGVGVPAAPVSGRKCSACGRPGHTARTCPQNSSTAKQSKSGPGCDECGSKGYRHKKGCSQEGVASQIKPFKEPGTKDFAALSDKRPGMSRMTFGRVKISQEHDIPAATVATNLDIAIDEVLKAYEVDTYDDYLKA